VRAGLYFYCKKINYSFTAPDNVPVILACNHPNSFLDAVILAGHYPKPIHFLARGDVFAKQKIAFFLRQLNMIPIHRLSEGREHLKYNNETFTACIEVLKKNGTLLIFSEGICKNEWNLRPLKKGTARLAHMAWYTGSLHNMVIKPTTFTYGSFTNVPITVSIQEGSIIGKQQLQAVEPSTFYKAFNARLTTLLNKGLNNPEALLYGGKKQTIFKKISLALPAFIGWVTHVLFYRQLKKIARQKTAGTVFFHSVFFALLLFLYPLYLLLVTFAAFCLTASLQALWLFLLLPLTVWCYKQYAY
jgi:1-acyl-sn-glycerol-3-phosphate acyltransferase